MTLNEVQSLLQNINALKQIDHPNIAKYMQVYEHQHSQQGQIEEGSYIYITMELCRDDYLQQIMEDKSCMLEIEMQSMVNTLLKTLKFLHDKDIVHGNISYRSIMFQDH